MCKGYFTRNVKTIPSICRKWQREDETDTIYYQWKKPVFGRFSSINTAACLQFGYNSLGNPARLPLLPAEIPMAPPDDDTKRRDLHRHGVLHPHPEQVSHELFATDPFFDRRDLVQVKYEMLRRVRVDGRSVSGAADAAGLSRPTFYSARAAFEDEGLRGLLPAKKGPRRAHKLTDDVLALLEEWHTAEPDLDMAALAERLQRQRELSVHPRSIQRALARRRKKKGAP